MSRYKKFYTNDEFFKWLNKKRNKVNIEFVTTKKDKIIVKYNILSQNNNKSQ